MNPTHPRLGALARAALLLALVGAGTGVSTADAAPGWESRMTQTTGAIMPEPVDPVTTLIPVPESSDPDAEAPLQRGASPMPTTRYELSTNGGWAPIRNDYQSLVIGNGKNGWMMDAVWHEDTKGFVGGFVYGSWKYKYCGWVKSSNIAGGDGAPKPHCKKNNGRVPTNSFAGLVNCTGCNGPTGVGLQRGYGGHVTGYRNIRPWLATPGGPGGQPSGQVTWKPGPKVGWRFVTPDNQWVLIADPELPGGANAVFVQRSKVRAFGQKRAGGSLAKMCKPGETPAQPTGPRRADWPKVCDLVGKPAQEEPDPDPVDPGPVDPTDPTTDPDPVDPTDPTDPTGPTPPDADGNCGSGKVFVNGACWWIL